MVTAVRWIIVVGLALVLFGCCWWVLQAYFHLDAGLAASVAAVPFSVPLTVGGAWASHARMKAQRSSIRRADETSIPPGSAGQLIMGDVPQEPPAFDIRTEIFNRLAVPPSQLRIFVVTGMRGVGKSQLVGALARKRIAERWRITAWLNAQNEAHIVVGLRRLAIDLGLDRPEINDEELAMSVRHWLETDGN